MKRFLVGTVLCLCLFGAAAVMATDINVVTIDQHDIYIKLNVLTRSAQVLDRGTIQVVAGWNVFQIADGASIQVLDFDFPPEVPPVDYLFVRADGSTGLEEELAAALAELELDASAASVLFHVDHTETVTFRFSHTAEFNQDVANMRFSNEQVGGEVTGTILDKGAYLSPAAYWYPQGKETLANYKVTALIPPEWESVADGNRLSSEIIDGQKRQTWENPFKSDGVMFMAGPFVERSVMADSVLVACYFFEEDTTLFDSYLSATADYIKMYSEMIGPYPYERFTVVENFFPTGYGMPAWTLLGQQVLRLPFIIGTSLGHEVLHNWWGNSVYVDYDKGNWCEALTVYGADYRYKLKQSESAAKDYRKNILKGYNSYINEGNDFPIREFKSRTSPGTRTIGYNKAMMVFHLIHQQIGEEAFFSAWKNVFSEKIGHKVAWEDWIDAFEKTSGADLSFIIPEWIDRGGAPMLSAEASMLEVVGSEPQVRLRLSQKGSDVYRLQIPIRYSGESETRDTVLTLEAAEAEYTLVIPTGVTDVIIDPDYHLFRHLYPKEVEPIVSAVLGFERQSLMADQLDSEMAVLVASFGDNLTGDVLSIEPIGDAEGEVDDLSVIVLNPMNPPQYLANKVNPVAGSMEIDGVSYQTAGHTFVLTGDHGYGVAKFMVILSEDFESLPRIGQLVPHYGKYSYLVFEGAKNVGKGQWVPDSSPLHLTLSKELPVGGTQE